VTPATILALAIFGGACLVGFLGCIIAAVQIHHRRSR